MKLRVGALPAWVYVLLLVVVGGLALLLPVQAELLAAGVMGLYAVLGANFSQSRHSRLWIGLCAAWALIGIALLVFDSSVRSSCLATYEGQLRAIGLELRPESQAYKQRNPSLTNDELLFDAAGVAERVWTRASIGQCQFRLKVPSYTWPSAVVAFILSALNALAVRRQGLLSLSSRPATAAAPSAKLPVIYDTFISYRHQEPDRTFVLELVNRLEENGLRVAIDERDFQPNQHFLTEMERCIKQSRFTLCILSRAYLQSGPCEEEAVITKVLDMSERKRRLVPLFVEEAELPVWLYGLVGINFHRPDPALDPFQKLVALLRQEPA